MSLLPSLVGRVFDNFCLSFFDLCQRPIRVPATAARHLFASAPLPRNEDFAMSCGSLLNREALISLTIHTRSAARRRS